MEDSTFYLILPTYYSRIYSFPLYHYNNLTQVTVIGEYGISFGTPIDWAYLTENQTYGDNKQIVYNSGKALGGTSCVNGRWTKYVD